MTDDPYDRRQLLLIFSIQLTDMCGSRLTVVAIDVRDNSDWTFGIIQ